MGISSYACLLLPPQRSPVTVLLANQYVGSPFVAISADLPLHSLTRILHRQRRPPTVHGRTLHLTL